MTTSLLIGLGVGSVVAGVSDAGARVSSVAGASTAAGAGVGISSDKLIFDYIYTLLNGQDEKNNYYLISNFTNAGKNIFEKYYPNAKPVQVPQPTEAPKPVEQPTAQEEPKPIYEIAGSNQPPNNEVIKKLLKTFKDPKEVTDIELRKAIIKVKIEDIILN